MCKSYFLGNRICWWDAIAGYIVKRERDCEEQKLIKEKARSTIKLCMVSLQVNEKCQIFISKIIN